MHEPVNAINILWYTDIQYLNEIIVKYSIIAMRNRSSWRGLTPGYYFSSESKCLIKVFLNDRGGVE
jgi:hypothetical protein